VDKPMYLVGLLFMNNYYIYAHIRPDKNEIFYIGKGKGTRSKSRNKRNKIWNDIVNKNNGVYKIIFLNLNLSEEEAFKLEMQYILEKGRLCDNTGCLANLTLGGEGTSGYIFSKEHKSKLSLALSGKNHPSYGKKHTLEHCNNMSKSLKGKTAWNKGKTHTEETRFKIRKKALGRKSPMKDKILTDEHKTKLSIAKKGKSTFQSKNVINTITNKIVANSATELYSIIDCKGRSLVTIQAYLNGNNKKPEWFTFEYVKMI
jgi:hypothetical protein